MAVNASRPIPPPTVKSAVATGQGPSSALDGRSVLLVICGGIAAYKALDLIRRLRERHVAVTTVMTASAKYFVTPLSVASLTGTPVHEDLFSLTAEAEMGHIELSRSADLLVVVPATANLMAKMAAGLADDLASTLLLATDKRVLMAPSMNVRMWLHPATRRNRARLEADGVLVVGPGEGVMACGEYGPGRMAEPLDIVTAIETALSQDTTLPLASVVPADTVGPPTSSSASTSGLRQRAASRWTGAPVDAGSLMAGRRVVVTSGPTHEPLDPVRYIANRSSGRQGHAIAAAAAAAGATVVLISGPVSIPDPGGVEVVHVETAREMLAAVEAALDRDADLFVAAAAVADWRPAVAARRKIKKQDDEPDPLLSLERNPDILASVARRAVGRPRLVVGFAAETDDLLGHAAAKLMRKGCDLIVANDVGPGTSVMGGDENEVHLVTRAGPETRIDSWPRLAKADVAGRLIAHLAALLDGPAS